MKNLNLYFFIYLGFYSDLVKSDALVSKPGFLKLAGWGALGESLIISVPLLPHR